MIDLMQIATQIGGVGGLLAVLIFFMYRIDRKATEKRIFYNAEETEKRVCAIHEAHSARFEHLLTQDQATREANTKALTELIALMVRLNGRLK